jgi:DNA-binding CsgD family transcriptional regulator
VGIAWSLLNRSYAATYAGEIEDAVRVGAQAVELTKPFADGPVGAWAGAVYGLALADSGDPARGHAVLMERCGGPRLERVPGAWRVIWLGALARCLLALDRVDEAAETATLAQQMGEEFGLPLALACSRRAAGDVALAQGDAATAAEHALAAAAGAGEMGHRIEAAHARVLAGRALAAKGDKDAAAAELEQAAAEFEACGAPRYRDQVEQDLRRLGRAVHRRTQRGKADGEGVEALTGRELEIAELVVDRRTNAEIAAELFLSIKTIETHMRNIFRKLGVGSRVEVARVLERTRAS